MKLVVGIVEITENSLKFFRTTELLNCSQHHRLMTPNRIKVSIFLKETHICIKKLFFIQGFSSISTYAQWPTYCISDFQKVLCPYIPRALFTQGRPKQNRTEGALCVKAMPRLKDIKGEKPSE